MHGRNLPLKHICIHVAKHATTQTVLPRRTYLGTTACDTVPFVLGDRDFLPARFFQCVSCRLRYRSKIPRPEMQIWYEIIYSEAAGEEVAWLGLIPADIQLFFVTLLIPREIVHGRQTQPSSTSSFSQGQKMDGVALLVSREYQE
jgi:hypothetical protein